MGVERKLRRGGGESDAPYHPMLPKHELAPESGGLSCGIAMCTCNAGAFLDAQLESVVEQDRMPQHIVISDDLSTDGTWEKLQIWASTIRRSKGVRITLIQNPSRLGVAKNFEQAIRLVDADIIFLADQDDSWLPSKVARMAACFEQDAGVLLAHADAILIDDANRDLGRSLFEVLRLSARESLLVREGRFLEQYCRRNLVTGMNTAFRRSLFGLALPIPELWIHDEWLAACAAASGRVRMIDGKLARYRQHGRNAIGVPVTQFSRVLNYFRRLFKTSRQQHLQYKLNRMDVLARRLAANADSIDPAAVGVVNEAKAHFARRLAFGHDFPSRVHSIYRECKSSGYQRFADGVAGVIRDLMRR